MELEDYKKDKAAAEVEIARILDVLINKYGLSPYDLQWEVEVLDVTHMGSKGKEYKYICRVKIRTLI